MAVGAALLYLKLLNSDTPAFQFVLGIEFNTLIY
jgi:hypothetical protein